MCLAAFPPTHRNRSPAPFVPPAVWSRSTATRDSAACEFQTPFRWRIRQGRPLQATRPALRPEGSHLSQVAGPPSLFFSADSVQRTILAEGAARQRRVRRHWNQLDSRCEVESMRNSKMTSADKITIVMSLNLQSRSRDKVSCRHRRTALYPGYNRTRHWPARRRHAQFPPVRRSACRGSV